MAATKRDLNRPLRQHGFSGLGLLMGTALSGLTMAATASLFLASTGVAPDRDLQIETDQAARAAVETMLLDLRLGGACLPVNGEFIALDGSDHGTRDEIVARSGLVRPDLSCIRTALTAFAGDGAAIRVESSDGFDPGMRAYVRHPAGGGEFFTVKRVDAERDEIESETALRRTYPPSSGVYAVDERRYFVDETSGPLGIPPELKLQLGRREPRSFAFGIERLDFRYKLRRNCPPCDVVDLPAGPEEWGLVQQILVGLTARSDRRDASGEFYRRRIDVAVSPRNLVAR